MRPERPPQSEGEGPAPTDAPSALPALVVPAAGASWAWDVDAEEAPALLVAMQVGGGIGFEPGDVFIGLSNGQVQRRDPNGNVLQTLASAPSGRTTGMAFDRLGNLYVTNFDYGTRPVSKFDSTGAFVGAFGSGYGGSAESIVFDAAGNAYVGTANGDKKLRKFDAAGTPVATFTPTTEGTHGTDWIDLAADQCTIYYTSEGAHVLRYDVCTNQQLATLPAQLHTSTRALRLLPTGGVLVADWQEIHRLDSAGNAVQTYDDTGQNCWYGLTLDPDGTSFWSADRCTANVYRFDIATGAQIKVFNTGTGANTVYGLAVFDGSPVVSTPPGTETIGASYVGSSRDPVNTVTGSFSYAHTDLAIPGRGPSPVFARAYNSNDTRVGPLGPGWTHNYAVRLNNPGDPNAPDDRVLVGPQGRSDRYVKNQSGSYAPPPAVNSTLARNADHTYVATHPDQSTWSFDSGGRLTRIKDRYGNESILTSNNSNQVTSIADPAGRGALTLVYGPLDYGNGTGCPIDRLCEVRDWQSPTPRVVRYAYDANGRLWKVTDREGKVTTYGYDGSSHRLTTITDANGHVAVTMTYDAQGRVWTQKDAKGLDTGQQTTFEYVTNGDGTRTTTVTYPATSFEPTWSPTVADTYDTQGRIATRVSRPISTETSTEQYGYDDNSNRGWVVDARGYRIDFCYDSRGNLTRRIDPPDASGKRPVARNTYDAKNNLVEVYPPRGITSPFDGTTLRETLCGQDLAQYLIAAYRTELAYDDASQTKLEKVTRTYTDPDVGLQTAVTKFEYTDVNNPGLVTKVIPPRGNTGPSPDYSFATTFSYYPTGSQAGMLQSVSGPPLDGNPTGYQTGYTYDPLGRRKTMVDPNGNVLGADPLQHTWEYDYDQEDRLTSARAPAPQAGGSKLETEFRYDPVGNRELVIDANGQVTQYGYDVRDSLAQVVQSTATWTAPTPPATLTPPPTQVIVTAYQYDHLGNLSRVTRAQNTADERAVDYTYDGLNRLRTEVQYPNWITPTPTATATPTPTLLTQYTYDANGHRVTLKQPLDATPGAQTTFTYDALNRLTSIDYSDPATADVTYSYDAHGNRLAMVVGTETTSYEYDELDRLLCVGNGSPCAQAATRVQYRYDRDGNRTRIIYPDGASAVTYSFDQASRLESLADWAARTTSYQYFPDGSLKTATNVNGTTANYSYDNALRLTQVWHQQGTNTITRHTYSGLDNVGNRTQVDEVLAQLGAHGHRDPWPKRNGDGDGGGHSDPDRPDHRDAYRHAGLDRHAHPDGAGERDAGRAAAARPEPGCAPGLPVSGRGAGLHGGTVRESQRGGQRAAGASRHGRRPGLCAARPGPPAHSGGRDRQRPGRERGGALDQLHRPPQGGAGAGPPPGRGPGGVHAPAAGAALRAGRPGRLPGPGCAGPGDLPPAGSEHAGRPGAS